MLKVTFRGHELKVAFGLYGDGSIAIKLLDDEGYIFTVATSWVEGLEDEELAIKDYSENIGMLDALINAGIVEKPHRTIHQGFVSFPIVTLTKEAYKEFLKQGKNL